MVFAFYLFRVWMREKRHLKTIEIGQTVKREDKEEHVDRDTSGYIVLNLPEDHRSLFIDLLKGFEDFARLRGYEVRFSFDSQTPNQVAFKFVIGRSGLTVSTDQVKQDFNDYIDRLRRGDALDDIPVVLTPEQHDLLLTTMKNRINFLQHNYKLTTNTVEYYERLLMRTGAIPSAFTQAPSFFVQTGGISNSRSIIAGHSPQIVQGDTSGAVSQSHDESVYIANSFNQRQEQISKLTELIEALKAAPQEGSQAEKAVINLEKVKDELTEEPQPDPNRIRRWLERTKNCIEIMKLGKETLELAKSVYTSFNLYQLVASQPL